MPPLAIWDALSIVTNGIVWRWSISLLYPHHSDPVELAHYPNIIGPNASHGGVGGVGVVAVAVASYDEAIATGGPSHTHYYYSTWLSVFSRKILSPVDFSSIVISLSMLSKSSIPPREVFSLTNYLSVMVFFAMPSKPLVRETRKGAKVREMSPIFTWILLRGVYMSFSIAGQVAAWQLQP